MITWSDLTELSIARSSDLHGFFTSPIEVYENNYLQPSENFFILQEIQVH